MPPFLQPKKMFVSGRFHNKKTGVVGAEASPPPPPPHPPKHTHTTHTTTTAAATIRAHHHHCTATRAHTFALPLSATVCVATSAPPYSCSKVALSTRFSLPLPVFSPAPPLPLPSLTPTQASWRHAYTPMRPTCIAVTPLRHPLCARAHTHIQPSPVRLTSRTSQRVARPHGLVVPPPC